MINWWRNLQFGRSIKGQLWLIFTALVIVPTISLGVIVYNHSADIQRVQLHEKLSIIAEDWAQVTQAHQDQIDKVLKREDALVEQKLVALTESLLDELDVNHKLAGGKTLSATSPVLQKISTMEISHSGFAFVLDSHGKYVASRANQFNGQTMLGHLTGEDKTEIADLLSNPQKLTAAGPTELRNTFQSETGGDYRDQLTVLAFYAPYNVFVGVSSYYTDFKSDDYEQSLKLDVRSKLAQQVVGSKGNIWALNSQGDYVVSKNRLQDNENVLEYKDANGQLFIKDVITRAKALQKGESFIVQYDWQEVGEASPSTRLAAVTYMPEWDWVIGASTYYSDYQSGLQQLQLYIGLVCLVFIAISSVGAYFFSMRITRPISRLQMLAVQAAAGHLDAQVDKVTTGASNEIGSLSQSFTIMLQRLKDKINELDTEKNIAEGERAKDEAILSSIADGVVATDTAGHVLIMNQIAEDMLDLEHGASMGQMLPTLLTLTDDAGDAIAPEEHPFYLTIQQKQQVAKTFTFTKKDDRKISLNITSAPVVQKDTATGVSSVVGTINIIRDVTKEKEVDRMKTEFISLASHQLRTPLSAIRWFSEMLVAGDAGKLTKEQTEFAKNIYDSTFRMIELVDSLLNVSRLESGRIMIEPVPTDVKELIQSIANELQVKITERKQTFILDVHSDLPKINLDPKLIRQVYLNLLTNAIKYTPEGGEITVMVSRKDGQLISQVTDNGYGIPQAEQVKMFQKFFRATNITAIETDGNGLGMYLVKSIVEASNGKIWFKSQEGKGTSFWFSIPLTGMVAKKGEVTFGS